MSEEEKGADPAVERASSNGWVPKEQWVEQGKSADEWVDHREFNLRGELMGRISSQTKEIKAMREQSSQYEERVEKLSKALRALGEQNKKLALKRIAEERSELRRIRAEAESEKDFDTVASIDEDLESLKTSEAELSAEVEEPAPAKPNQPTIDPDSQRIFQEWVEENPWYATNEAAFKYAEFVAGTLPREGKDFRTFLDEVASKVTSMFEGDTGKPPPRKGLGMEPSANGAGRKKGGSGGYASRLSDEERELARTFVQEGALDSIEDYAKQLYGD